MVNSCNQIHLRACLIVVIKHAYDVNKQMPQEESFATRLQFSYEFQSFQDVSLFHSGWERCFGA